MNKAFHKFASELLEKMTPAEIKATCEKHGIILTSIHSGKKLSEVPYDQIWVGMEVVSLDLGVGKVDAKYDKEGEDKDNLIRVEWPSCSQTTHWHYWYNNVTVK